VKKVVDRILIQINDTFLLFLGLLYMTSFRITQKDVTIIGSIKD